MIGRPVKAILADPSTPQWVKDGLAKLRRDNPIYAAFLEALHDLRVGATAP